MRNIMKFLFFKCKNVTRFNNISNSPDTQELWIPISFIDIFCHNMIFWRQPTSLCPLFAVWLLLSGSPQSTKSISVQSKWIAVYDPYLSEMPSYIKWICNAFLTKQSPCNCCIENCWGTKLTLMVWEKKNSKRKWLNLGQTFM